MAFYDSETNTIICIPPQPVIGYPGWEIIDCGCCGGIEWGGESPHECRQCKGAGYMFRHKKSGVLAEYPGGKFLGRKSYKMESEE